MKVARLTDGEAEIFATIQGEGATLGCPAVFLRLSLCNLHCHWCDTDYTWNWEGTPWEHERDAEPGYRKYSKKEQLMELSPKEILQMLCSYSLRRLVITGGEPLLQQGELLTLLQLLKKRDPAWQVEIETNGTLIPEEQLDKLVDQYNTSPKLANSHNPKHLRLNPQALRYFAQNPKAWFKFVITEPSDLEEVDKLVNEHELPETRILLMLAARVPAALQERLAWLADECIQRNWRLTPRLHLQIWGSQRAK